jgi:DNA-binding NtrC family response regulator
VVLVMASHDPVLRDIQELLEELRIPVRLVASLQRFQQVIRREPRAEVVITGVSLPDGNWCDVLTSTIRCGSAARVLICSPEADERFWSEAIWRGVHDILIAPFSSEDIERAVDVRYRHGQEGQMGEHDPNGDRESEQRSATFEPNPVAIALPAIA